MGCWAIGGLWWGNDVDDATSALAIEAALDEGIDWFDTAPVYGHGHADEVLVRTLGERRHSVTIATKVGVRWDNPQRHATSDLSPDHVRADTEASLRRLGLEVIPLLQVHWPCERGTPLEDTLDALVRLRDEGKVRHIGLCNYGAAELARAKALAPIVTLQTAYSMARRELEGELLGVATGQDGGRALGVLAYEPLARGLLTGKFRSMPRFPKTDLRARDERFTGRRFLSLLNLVMRLDPVAQKAGVPLAALATGWVASRPGITSVIAGAKRPEQIRESALGARLADHAQLFAAVDRRLEAAGRQP
jgi:aryl-alcohol dehydrogenase-like predicted oxidoreductase